MDTLLIIVEFVLLIVFQILGIGFHVMQKIIKLGNDNPSKTRKEITGIFFVEDWDTLFVSGLILFLVVASHIAILFFATVLREWDYYILASFAVSLMLGYGGQRFIYKQLGTAEAFLNRKVEHLTKVS
jgi:hypothetical protein